MEFDGAEAISSHVLQHHALIAFRIPPRQFTILAAFLISSEASGLKTISLATGTKCLPVSRLPEQGDALHDSHAEILARRAAVRWLYDEIARPQSPWIRKGDNGLYELNQGVRVHLYISTPPCGDASTRFLACFQDEGMAALKDAAVVFPLSHNGASRGRDNYSLYGVLRTKPGRADSPPTISMSCADKIAVWNVLGFQGALASRIMKPMYISSITIGEVSEIDQAMVREDCERALWGRVRLMEFEKDLPSSYHVHDPSIRFTPQAFRHSHTACASTHVARKSCNESLCWFADCVHPHDVLIDGLKRGVSPKHRHNRRFWPQCSKISLFQLHKRTLSVLGLPDDLPDTSTYYEHKQSMVVYQSAKQALMGDNGPFSGWIKSGKQWESFDAKGECHPTDAP